MMSCLLSLIQSMFKSPVQGPGVTDLSCSPLAQRLRAERPRQAARKAWLADLLGEWGA
jgi:hypothetical protein